MIRIYKAKINSLCELSYHLGSSRLMTPISVGRFNCSGTERRLNDCPHKKFEEDLGCSEKIEGRFTRTSAGVLCYQDPSKFLVYFLLTRIYFHQNGVFQTYSTVFLSYFLQRIDIQFQLIYRNFLIFKMALNSALLEMARRVSWRCCSTGSGVAYVTGDGTTETRASSVALSAGVLSTGRRGQLPATVALSMCG